MVDQIVKMIKGEIPKLTENGRIDCALALQSPIDVCTEIVSDCLENVIHNQIKMRLYDIYTEIDEKAPGFPSNWFAIEIILRYLKFLQQAASLDSVTVADLRTQIRERGKNLLFTDNHNG